MKAVIGIIVAIIIIAGGGYALVKHNNDKTKAKTESTEYSNSQSTKKPIQTTSTQSPASSTNTSSSAATSSASSVSISNFAFSPADMTVKKGTTVTWTNKDSVAHTVAETDSKDGPKSNDLNQNQTYTFTYSTVGTFKYHCSIHPNMTGTVTVTE